MLREITNSVIRDNIDGNRLIPTPNFVRQIIDTPEFQRLRHIHQLGLASCVFPTAEHSRFAHSLGVYATAGMAFDHLKERSTNLQIELPGLAFDSETELDFLIAALCHDLGHTAYSHVLEGILLPNDFLNHEQCTISILNDNNKISEKIKSIADIEAICFLLNQSHPNRALTLLISSQFDVDRCDYIIRDSYMSGVEYGKYDFKWLLHSLTLETNDYGQPILILDGPRGSDALRQFLLARSYLHKHIYFHSTVRGAQLLLKSIFQRIWDLGPCKFTKQLVPNSFSSLIDQKPISIGQFLDTTDIEVQTLIKNLSKEHPDPTLRYLCQCFVERKLPKCVLDTGKMLKEHLDLFSFIESDDKMQGVLFQGAPWEILHVIRDLRDLSAQRLASRGLPREISDYLVSVDRIEFESPPPSDLLFSLEGKTIPLERAEELSSLGLVKPEESLTLHRIYVPREISEDARHMLEARFFNSNSISMVGS